MIFDIRKFSVHDGPGIRTTVFFKGCPLSCQWCHNPESQAFDPELMLWPQRCIACDACLDACRQGAIHRQAGVLVTDRGLCAVCGACAEACSAQARQVVGRAMTIAEVMAQVERDRPFFDESGGGVTFSGGESLAQPAFLRALLEASKSSDLHTAVDTSGYASWDTLESIVPWTDLFLYDLKLFDEARHQAYTGVSNQRILENLRRLSARGARIILRIPVIPGVNADPASLTELASFAAALPHLERVDLLAYHPAALGKYERLGRVNRLADTPSPCAEQMQAISAQFAACGLNGRIGG